VTHSAIVLIRKFWRLPWCDRLLLVDAIRWLAVARLAIAVMPFRYVGRLAACPVRRQELPQQTRRIVVSRVRWAVAACARKGPGRAMCFEQGLAAQLMLRRRGVPSVLYYGAAPDHEHGLRAHVWVRDNNVDITGCEIASRYALLATFPDQSDSSLGK
jgi:hypothetical protein